MMDRPNEHLLGEPARRATGEEFKREF